MISPAQNKVRRQQGFTLIELLVAGTILVVLTAVALVGYSRFFGVADAEAAASELEDIQQAMHAMMAHNKIGIVDSQTVPTNEFHALPTGDGSEYLAPEFLRVGRKYGLTKCWYIWDSHGIVKQADCASGGRAGKQDGENADAGEGQEGADGQDGGDDLADLGNLRQHWESIRSLALEKGNLNQGQTNLFDSKLQDAETALAEGDTEAAMRALQTFINHVNAFTNSGALTEEQGSDLMQAGSQAIILLGNQS